MKGFCEKCRDTVEYSIKKVVKFKNIRGKEIEYLAKEAYCDECQSEIFVSEIRDYNIEALDNEYRSKENFILVPEIARILEIYDIGKRPFSIMLGWGEGTLTRYLCGDIPTRQYSDILKKILDDPYYMLEILEKAEGRVSEGKITERAFNSCKIAALKRISDKEFEEVLDTEDKIDSVVKYIIFNSTEITPLALQKLLYYSQSFYKVFNGVFLFDNDCEAWVHGPVYKNIYFKYKDHGYNPIDENVSIFTRFDLTETEKDVINSVITNFGCYSGKVLEKMTHSEMPWRKTRGGLSDDQPSDRFIEKSLIEEYFSQIIKKFNMINLSDIRDYSTDLFKKVN